MHIGVALCGVGSFDGLVVIRILLYACRSLRMLCFGDMRDAKTVAAAVDLFFFDFADLDLVDFAGDLDLPFLGTSTDA